MIGRTKFLVGSDICQGTGHSEVCLDVLEVDIEDREIQDTCKDQGPGESDLQLDLWMAPLSEYIWKYLSENGVKNELKNR